MTFLERVDGNDLVYKNIKLSSENDKKVEKKFAVIRLLANITLIIYMWPTKGFRRLVN